jgi:DNA polymerase III alpha subunit
MTTAYNTQTGMEMLYRGTSIRSVAFEQAVVNEFNNACDQLELMPINSHIDYNLDFVIPDHYKQLDVRSYVQRALDTKHLESSTEAQQRVEHELDLFEARNLFPVLQALIYIVDTMKKNNIVWGVGRGSSVASYCLYLLDVHRIDSIKHGLDIREFLR